MSQTEQEKQQTTTEGLSLLDEIVEASRLKPADDGYYGTEAEADLRGIKQEYARQNIILFAAAIGDDKDAIQRIYQEGFLDITRLDDLPKNLTILIKQYLR